VLVEEKLLRFTNLADNYLLDFFALLIKVKYKKEKEKKVVLGAMLPVT
jgi:hypothetical protein